MKLVRALLLLPLAIACSDSLFPADNLVGTWAGKFTVPGASLVMALNQGGIDVGGTGTYAIEAGRSGTLQVIGTYERPTVRLTLHYDSGVDFAFVGTVTDQSHMTGALGANHLEFERR